MQSNQGVNGMEGTNERTIQRTKRNFAKVLYFFVAKSSLTVYRKLFQFSARPETSYEFFFCILSEGFIYLKGNLIDFLLFFFCFTYGN